MKKKKLLIIVAMMLVCTLIFFGCNRKKTVGEDDGISRLVSAFYVGENENYSVSIEVGKREVAFVADGKVGELESFVDLSVIPLKTNEQIEIPFCVACEDKSLSGRLKANEFGEYYCSIEVEFIPCYVLIGEGEDARRIDVANVLQGKLSALDAVNIAKNEFADKIENAIAERGALNREIYVKLISGDREKYYYYVAFIGEGVDYWAILINPDDGAVISKK